MKRLANIAKRYIQPSTNRVEVLHHQADVKDIIETILHADGMSAQFTRRFAPYLKDKDDYRTLKNIWSFVRRYIRYERDQAGNEVIKSPGRTWADRFADCKSMSVMVGSLLKNLGFRYFYRVAFYDSDNPQQGHIYPVAILPGGEKVIIDAVHHSFDEEVTFWRADDYNPSTGERQEDVAAVAGPATLPWMPWAMIAGGLTLMYWYNQRANDQSKLHTRCRS